MKRSRNPEQESGLITEKPLPNPTLIRSLLGDFLVSNILRLVKVSVTYEGNENLKKITGPVVIALAPHNGHSDHPIVMNALRRASKQLWNKSFILSAAGYWDRPKIKELSQLVIRNMPVAREGSEQILEDRRIIGEHIRAGDIPIVWVEGTRTNHGKPMRRRKVKTGIAQFAIDTRDLGTQILPVFVTGAEDIMPPGTGFKDLLKKRKSHNYRVRVIFGEPISVANTVPDNYERLSPREQFKILRGFAGQLHAFYIAQEEYEGRLNQQVPPY